jgi:hypothetical protein
VEFGTYHWDLEERNKLEKMANRGQILVPGGDVVTKPVANVAPSANKGTASDNHRALVRTSFQHAFPTGFAHHGPVQVVCIILGPTSLMDKISLGGPVAEGTPRVLDLVGRVEKVSPWKPSLVTTGLSMCETSSLRRGSVALVAREVTETGRFVHVDPECININSSVFVEERAKLVVPVALCVLMKPIRKDGRAWPNLAFPGNTSTGF